MLSFRLRELATSSHPGLKNALRLYQLGRYQWAVDEFSRAPELLDTRAGAALHLHALRAVQRHATDTPAVLAWRIPSDTWESDWIRFILNGAFERELWDPALLVEAPNIIVVDNQLTELKSKDYEAAFKRGSSITLIHLSDEAYSDSLDCYDWCDQVFRNFWSSIISEYRNVRFFPLGYKAGISGASANRPVSDRDYLWSFAGDPNKSERAAMLKSMSSIGPGFIHETAGFCSPDALETSAYERLLSSTVYAPCPAGWVNVETFRIWEALECGAIPIIETRGSDYFDNLLGPNPLLYINNWADAHKLVLRTGPEAECKRLQCLTWWRNFKRDLAFSVQDRLVKQLSV